MIEYLQCPQCKASQNAEFSVCLRCGEQMPAALPALEEMSTEGFLVWMLENCAMDEEEARKAQLLVNTFFIVQTVRADFDVQLVAESFPKLNALNSAWRLPA